MLSMYVTSNFFTAKLVSIFLHEITIFHEKKRRLAGYILALFLQRYPKAVSTYRHIVRSIEARSIRMFAELAASLLTVSITLHDVYFAQSIEDKDYHAAMPLM